jgi:GT2 family glycosyltransferase
MKIAVLIPVFNKLEYTRKCLSSLQAALEQGNLAATYEIVVIDDGSTDGTGDYIRSGFPAVHVVTGDGNLWWSGAINAGASYAANHLDADYLLLWNNDVEPLGAYLQRLPGLLQQLDGNTIVGSKIYADEQRKTVWSVGGSFNRWIGKVSMIGYLKPEQEKYQRVIEPHWLTGMGTILPIAVFKKIGRWDEQNFPQYLGDVDYTYRAYLSGFRLIVHPELMLVNDVSNTGLSHGGEMKKLLRLFTDNRSLYNFRVNRAFLKKYAKGPLAYLHLCQFYAILIMSFIKAILTKPFKTS